MHCPAFIDHVEGGTYKEVWHLTQTEAKMGKKIAPRGEEGLREILVKLAAAGTEAAGFLSRYLEAWESSDQTEMEDNLWHFEPRFAELMENFRFAMRCVWALAGNNRDAWYFVYTVPPISRRNSDIKYVRRALEVTLMVANLWLATHPVEEESFVVRVVEYLLDKTSDRFWLWFFLFLVPVFECIRHPWLALQANKRENTKK